MEDYFCKTTSLHHKGVMTMLQAGVQKAESIGQPQCIVIVDASGEVLGEIRMTGSKFLSRKSALSKALTASSIRAASSSVPDSVRPAISAATHGDMTGLAGGLPIIVEGECIGAIGVGSGAPEQDVEVAMAALESIGCAPK